MDIGVANLSYRLLSWPAMGRHLLDQARLLDADDPQGKVLSEREVSATMNVARPALVRKQGAGEAIPRFERDEVEALGSKLPMAHEAGTPGDGRTYTLAEALTEFCGVRDRAEQEPTQLPATTLQALAGPRGVVRRMLAKASPSEILETIPRSSWDAYLLAGRPDRDPDSTDERYQKKVLFDFLMYSVARLHEDPTVQRERAQELVSSLEARGATDVSRSDPRASLRRLSRDNVQRLQVLRKYAHGTAGMENAEHVIAQMHLSLVHNTCEVRGGPATPILSSRTLEGELGVSGLNTFRFNKEFLRNDNEVFFWVNPSFHDQPVRSSANYSRSSLVLEPDFARENAWISPFIMFPHDLLELSRRQEPELFDEFITDFERAFPRDDQRYADAWMQADQQEGHAIVVMLSNDHAYGEHGPMDAFCMQNHAFQRMQSRLSRLDFTVGDFETLIRDQMLYELDRIRQAHPERFEHQLEQLTSFDTRELRFSALDRLYSEVLKQLGIPGPDSGAGVEAWGVEAKVPGRVPPWAISQTYRFEPPG